MESETEFRCLEFRYFDFLGFEIRGIKFRDKVNLLFPKRSDNNL
jgi:hypothetical protein